jgi:hypothetical protein
MSLKTRLARVEAAHTAAQLDRYARFAAHRYRLPFDEVRQEIEAKALALRADPTRLDDPELRQQAAVLQQEIDEWEERGRHD